MDIYELLEKNPVKLNYGITDYLTDYGETVHYSEGDTIVREGDKSEDVFIILEGTAQVYKADSHNTHAIASAGRGAIFGEMGVFLDLKRSATIVAASPLRALKLSNDDFLNALLNFPQLTFRLLKSLCSKISAVNDRLLHQIDRRIVIMVGYIILETYNSANDERVMLNLPQLLESTGLSHTQATTALINFKRLNIISGLSLQGDDLVYFNVNGGLLQSYLRSIIIAKIES